MKKFILSLILLVTSVYAETTGSASILVFLNDTPLQHNEIRVDGKYSDFTDEDGMAVVVLESGDHQIEIFAKDKNGANIGYVKKQITVKESKDTQVIATFEGDNKDALVNIDTPIGEASTLQAITKFGLLNGTILSSETSKPVANARIFVKGTSAEARTDENGKFTIKIPAETSASISVIHSEYASQTLDALNVQENATLSKQILLTPASMELEEFVVLAPKVEGTIASIMQEEKKSTAVTNIIGSEQMSKQGDSSAAGAIRRVTGVTLVDGTDVYVRGLGGRYSNVEMNSMPLPSPDPQRRTVPLDIFPSAVIGSMKVQKSATADIPASFGGGYVDIRTKGKSKENYLKVTAEIKANSNTASQRATHAGSSTDWMGSDDGYRALPSQVLNDSKIVVGQVVPSFNPANQQDYQQGVASRNLSTYQEAMPFGGKFELEGAYNIDIADEHQLSFFANYSYKQEFTSLEEQYYSYAYSQTTNSLYDTPEQYGTIFRSMDQYKNSLIANVEYNFADALNLKYTKLFTKVSEKTTKIADGIANSDSDWKIRYDLNWEERSLDANQINGDFKYKLADLKNNFTFGLEMATALLDQPDRVKYAYYKGTAYSQIDNPYLHRYSPNVYLNMTVEDKQNAYFLKNKTDFNLMNEGEYLELGINQTSKTRESRYNKYQMQLTTSDKFTEDIDTIYNNHIMNYDGTFRLDISFQPAYWYDAESDELSYYTKLMLKPLANLEILIGARSVDYSQTVYSYTNDENVFTPIYRKASTFTYNKILPSANIKYSFSKADSLNFAFSQTYIVPDLREFTEGSYFHPYDVATVEGNPDLVNTDIMNYDLKYNHYFSDTENIGIGLFYKDLKNPIEDVLLPSSSLPRYGYANADSATLYGIEFDGRKSFDMIDNKLKDLYVFGNVSYTKSDVSLTTEQQTLYTTNHRDLQGLSPIVINLALAYETKPRSLTLSYNKMWERIRKVGTIDGQDLYPDDYEDPAATLDFVWIEKFTEGLTGKIKLQNLLDGETVWYQGDKDHITRRFKKGQFYSVELSYKY